MATRNCANCSYAEVNAAINGGGSWGAAADNGDIIVLPANKATSGTFTVTYGASTSASIAFNASAATVSTALNNMASVTSDGGVTVAQVLNQQGTPVIGFYEISWVTNGIRATAMTGNSSLVPTNDVKIGQKTVAIAGTKEVRVIVFGASWTTTLEITTGITFQGASDVTGDHTVAAASWTTDDQTIILDDIVLSGGHGPMIRPTLTKNHVFRLTGITFRRGARVAKSPEPGAITIKGECPEDAGGRGTGSIRIDHCHFDQLGQIGQWWADWTYGVTDHCKWTCGTTGQTTQGLSMNNGELWGGNIANGEIGSWVYPTDFGTDKFAFVEDCLFYNLGTGQTAGKIDGQYGGRFVLRYSLYHQTSVIGGHGTESGGFHRGIRAAEYYNIARTGTTSQSWGEQRSGVRLIHHNTWDGPGGSGTSANVHREFWSFKFGGATGNTSWDKNDTEGGGVWTENGSPNLYASGTAASDTAAPVNQITTLTASGSPGWSINAFAGMMLQNTSVPLAAGPVPCIIISNTGSTITYSTDDGGYGTPVNNSPQKKFTTGQGFAVYNVLAALDQVGYGQCDDRIYVVDQVPFNLAYGDQRWPHQAREPIYCWQNYAGATLVTTSSSMPTVVENREFYNQNDNFASNHTVGIGVGLLSARPSSGLVAGVGYWATDTSTLYIATSATTWSTYYTPYQYPHPLTGAAEGKIILLSGALNYGNVIIGQAPTATLGITDTGDESITVTSITYPTGFSGLTTGFTVSPGNTTNRTVTFTPLLEQLYSGNITVASDADSGSETIACSGTGVVESGGGGGGGKGKGHKKGALSRRA